MFFCSERNPVCFSDDSEMSHCKQQGLFGLPLGWKVNVRSSTNTNQISATVVLCHESIVVLPIPRATTSLDTQQPVPITGTAIVMIATLTSELLVAISNGVNLL